MSEFKCLFCPRTFANRNRLTLHMNTCVDSAEVEPIVVNHPAPIRNISKLPKLKQKQYNDIKKIEINQDVSVNKISFKDIKFRNVSKVVKYNKINSNMEIDCTNAGPSGVINTDDLSNSLADISFELETDNNNSNCFELDPADNLLEGLESSLHEYQEFSNLLLNDSAFTEEIRNSSENDEFDQKHNEFPNEAYADLMVLVTKHKLSNAARNAIISFFNKHSNLEASSLPKNMKQGKDFMNNIKSNLSYKKTKVLDLNNTEYFLYHLDLISCIKNILKIPDIAQNLEFEYKELYKTAKVYITFNFICKYNYYCFLLIYFYFF